MALHKTGSDSVGVYFVILDENEVGTVQQIAINYQYSATTVHSKCLAPQKSVHFSPLKYDSMLLVIAAKTIVSRGSVRTMLWREIYTQCLVLEHIFDANYIHKRGGAAPVGAGLPSQPLLPAPPQLSNYIHLDQKPRDEEKQRNDARNVVIARIAIVMLEIVVTNEKFSTHPRVVRANPKDRRQAIQKAQFSPPVNVRRD